jgi:uncharacterized protein Yka (UPF0111/DUF47 family)
MSAKHFPQFMEELESTVRQLQQQLERAEADRDEFYETLLADLRERDRLMVSWVKEMVEAANRCEPVLQSIFKRITK